MSGNIAKASWTPASGTPQMVVGEALSSWRKYFSDESRKEGDADCIALPQNAEEVAVALREAVKNGWSVTISGARTGITAAAVPDGIRARPSQK